MTASAPTPELYDARVDDILVSATNPAWAAVAANDLLATLADHAHCEKKAAAAAISMLNHYPDDVELVRACVGLAKEELDHFREIYALLEELGATLPHDQGDPYVQELLKLVRQAPRLRKLDRLLISALIEARSCERFRLLADELERRGDDVNARRFRRLQHSESGHATLFVGHARRHAGVQEANHRLAELAALEAEVVVKLPILPRIH